jgi:signal transduction histidine kinase
MLEQLGHEAAIRAFCRDLSTTRHVAIDVRVQQVPHPVPQDVALCVYRVTQESLHNVVRHSGGSSAVVALGATNDKLLLSVIDSGVGFDADAPTDRASLGLRSMRERVRLVNGQLSVQSKRGEGTRVEVRLPFPSATGH